VATAHQILHVDDDPDIRLLMSASLQEFGYRVMTAGTIAEALQLAKDFQFDLCILDVKLPDGTGIDLCKQLRELQEGAPIVYYSGHADVATAEQALEICGDAYIKKPVSITELQETINGLLNRTK
jgi:two-component system, NtrC family, response regulator PilR